MWWSYKRHRGGYCHPEIPGEAGWEGSSDALQTGLAKSWQRAFPWKKKKKFCATCSNCKHLHGMGRQLYGVCVCVHLGLAQKFILLCNPLSTHFSSTSSNTKNYRFAPPTYFLGLLGRKFGLCVSAGAVWKAEILIFCVSHTKRKPGRGSRGREIRLAENQPTQFPDEGTHKAFLQISWPPSGAARRRKKGVEGGRGALNHRHRNEGWGGGARHHRPQSWKGNFSPMVTEGGGGGRPVQFCPNKCIPI